MQVFKMANQTISQSDFYVYVLFRPDNGNPFYVGKGRGQRWRRHVYDRGSSKGNLHKNRIIKNILSTGAEVPCVKIASGISERDAFEIERSFIKAIGRSAKGGPLANLTDGGDGICGFRHSAESRLQMSRDRKGIQKSDATRIAMSAAQKGKSRAFLIERNKSERMRALNRAASAIHREVLLKQMGAMTAEAMSARNRKVQQSISPERRREIALKRAAAKTPQEHSDRIRAMNAAFTPEERSARQLKAAETRRINKLTRETQCASGKWIPPEICFSVETSTQSGTINQTV